MAPASEDSLAAAEPAREKKIKRLMNLSAVLKNNVNRLFCKKKKI